MSTFIGMGANKPTLFEENKIAELEKQVANITEEKETAEAKIAELEKQVAKLKKPTKKATK